MRFTKVAASAALVLATLALTACAADPEVGSLETRLSELPGVNGAAATVVHAGAPWNTEIAVWLYLEDASQDAVLSAVEKAVPVLADDEASRHPVAISFVHGRQEDFPGGEGGLEASIPIGAQTYTALGLEPGSAHSIVLSPGELQQLAESW